MQQCFRNVQRISTLININPSTVVMHYCQEGSDKLRINDMIHKLEIILPADSPNRNSVVNQLGCSQDPLGNPSMSDLSLVKENKTPCESVLLATFFLSSLEYLYIKVVYLPLNGI